MTVRDAFFVSPDAYVGLKARAVDRGVGLDPVDLKRGDPAPLFGLPVIQDQDVPPWILAVIVNAGGAPIRCAILPGGRIFLPRGGDRFSLDGVDWIPVPVDPGRLSEGVPCYMSLHAIEAGDRLWRPAEPATCPFPLARIRDEAVRWILAYRPRRIGR
jgi:hypothetical protein